MIGSINNVSSLNYSNTAKANNVSFGKKRAYTTTTTTTVTEGKSDKKTGFFKKIGLAIVGTIGAIFAIGKISEMKDKKAADNDKKPTEKPANGDNKIDKKEIKAEAKNRTEAEIKAKEEAEKAQAEYNGIHGIGRDVKSAKDSANVFMSDEVSAEDGTQVDETEIIEDETPVVAEEIEEAPVEETTTEEVEDEASVEEAEAETMEDKTPVVTEEIEAPVAEEIEETPVAEAEAAAVAVAPEVDKKQQAQALVTAGMAGAMVAPIKAEGDNKQVSAADYADSQRAQLGVATPKKTISKAKLENGEKILEDAFNVSLNGEQTASELKATLKEFRQYVKEANKNDFEDIVTEDGGVVAFEKRVEYPEGETTGIVDEAITKHTREQEKQEILTATKLDAQGNLVGTATYINGRIDGLTKIEADGTMTTIQADDKGVLVAKGMQPTEKGVAFDEILNYDYVGDDRKLVSCAKGVKIENGVTDIKKAYKFDNDNNLKEFAKDVAITPDNKGVLGNNYQFESDNLVAAAALYNGDVSALGKGKAAEVYTFENDKLASTAKKAEYTVNV